MMIVEILRCVQDDITELTLVFVDFYLLPLEESCQFPPPYDQLLTFLAMPIFLDGKMAFLAHPSARMMTIAALQRLESRTK